MNPPIRILLFLLFAVPCFAQKSPEALALQEIQRLDVPVQPPSAVPRKEDFQDENDFMAAYRKVMLPYYEVESARLWKLADAQNSFVRQFPGSPQAEKMRSAEIRNRLTTAQGLEEYQNKVLKWATAKYQEKDLPVTDALQLAGYLLMEGWQNPQIPDTPKTRALLMTSTPTEEAMLYINQLRDDAVLKIVQDFDARYSGTPEAAYLDQKGAEMLSRANRAVALTLLDKAEKLASGELLDEIKATRFRLTAEGKPLPPLRFTSIDGREIDTEKMRGKVLLLDFWATWCGPCIQKLPEIKKLYEAAHDRGLEIIGISEDTDRNRLRQFVKMNGMEWPQYFDSSMGENPIWKPFGLRGIPSVWIVDKEGKIVLADGEPTLELVNRLLDEPVISNQ